MTLPDHELSIPNQIVEQMLFHARRENPLECCGLLGGIGHEARSIYMLENEAHSPIEFLSTIGLIRPFIQMRERGEELLAIYHSHPSSAAVPSLTDCERNYYPDTIHLIISLAGEIPVIRAFRLGQGGFVEVAWTQRVDRAATPK
jgi:proteasome lid subunit RPN8/RPN11